MNAIFFDKYFLLNTKYANLTVEKVSMDITNIFPAVSTQGSRVFIIIKIKIFLVRNEV